VLKAWSRKGAIAYPMSSKAANPEADGSPEEKAVGDGSSPSLRPRVFLSIQSDLILTSRPGHLAGVAPVRPVAPRRAKEAPTSIGRRTGATVVGVGHMRLLAARRGWLSRPSGSYRSARASSRVTVLLR